MPKTYSKINFFVIYHQKMFGWYDCLFYVKYNIWLGKRDLEIEKSLSSPHISHLVRDVLLSQLALTESPFSLKIRKNIHFWVIISCLAEEFSTLDASRI